MRKNIILKSTLRQFWRSIFLALLVGVAAFFLVSRVMEYDIVVNEIERISRHYRSIGYFTSTRGEAGISEAADFIRELESPYVAFEDFNQSGFATLHDMYNTLTDANMHAQARYERLRIYDREVFFYGELVGVFGQFRHFAPRTILTFRVDTVVAGYPEWITPGREIEVDWNALDGGSLELRDELFAIGERYFIRAGWRVAPVGAQYRSVLVPLYSSRSERLWTVPVEIDEEVDMNDPYLAHLPDVLETIYMNHRSMRVWTSIDLTAKPQTQRDVEKWHLHRGRWINHTDYLQENKVAVVHQAFANERNVVIGDSITLTLWDLNVYPTPGPTPGRGIEPYSWGLRGHDRRWQEAMRQEITLEIVGIFTYRDSAPTGSHAKDIWVPTSVVPEWFGIEDFPSNLTYNFVLHSTTYQEAFYEAHGEALGEFGGGGIFYQFRFMEHGAEQFWETVEPIIESLWRNVMLFAGIFLLSLLLIIFLYFRQHRRNVAILRALGTPKWQVTRYLLSPILLLWFPLLLLGSYIAREFAETAAVETLAPLWEYGDHGAREISTDITWFIGVIAVISCLGWILVFLSACAATNGRILERLQGEVSKNRKKERKEKGPKKKQTIQEIISETFSEKLSFESMDMLSYLVTDLSKNVKNQHRANWRNINRRILRTPIRTILVSTIALLSVIAFGWLQSSINYNEAEIERMWNTIVVGEVHRMAFDASNHTEMEQIVSVGTVADVLHTGFIDSVYLEVGFEFAYLVPPLPDGGFPYGIWEEWGSAELFARHRNRLFAVTDLAELERDNNEPTDIFGRPRTVSTDLVDLDFDPLKIVYAQGFDPAAFDYGVAYDFDMVIPIILPAYVMEDLELEFGDHVFISHPFDQRREDHPFINPPRHRGGRTTWSLVRPWTITAEIVGMYTGIIHRPFAHNAIVIPYGIIQPIRNSLPAGRLNRIAAYSTVRFFVDPARNRETEDLRELLERLVSNPWAGTVPLSFTLRDEELIFVVQQLEQNLELLNFLYPIVLAVSLVIALGLSALILLQNVKNAAVMRILGMSKKGTRWAFLKEQTVITLIGLFLGLLVFAVIENTFMLDARIYLFIVLYLAAMFLGSFLGAILISNRAPLDLLQVKE